jgi:hypothetical protein
MATFPTLKIRMLLLPMKSIILFTSHVEGKDSRTKEISSSVNLKLAMNLMHSSKPAKIVYSPPKGFFRKYKSNLQQIIKMRQIETS